MGPANTITVGFVNNKFIFVSANLIGLCKWARGQTFQMRRTGRAKSNILRCQRKLFYVQRKLIYVQRKLFYVQRKLIYVDVNYFGDNCIQNVHLGRYIVGYIVGNFVLRRRVSGAVKRNFRPYIYPDDDIPPQMNILNMVIPILMHFSTFIRQRHSILHQTEASSVTQNNYVTQSQATSLITSVLRRYIAEYTDANYWCYPIRRRVTFASALEFTLDVK